MCVFKFQSQKYSGESNTRRWSIFFKQLLNFFGLGGDFVAFKVLNLKEMRQLRIQLRQFQDLLNLLANPFIIRKRINAARNEEGLQEFTIGIVKPVERLEIQFALEIGRNLMQVIEAVVAN